MNGRVNITDHAQQRCLERIGSIDLQAAYRRSRPLTARERRALLRNWIGKGTWPRKQLRSVDALFLIDPETACVLVCKARTIITVFEAPFAVEDRTERNEFRSTSAGGSGHRMNRAAGTQRTRPAG